MAPVRPASGDGSVGVLRLGRVKARSAEVPRAANSVCRVAGRTVCGTPASSCPMRV